MSADKDFESDAERKKQEGTGGMTVREAGHLGGEKGGHKGGQKVKHLIEEGEKIEEEKSQRKGHAA